MALQLVLEHFSFDETLGGGVKVDWRPGDLREDTLEPVAAYQLRGLAVVPWDAPTMTTARDTYLGAHGRDDDPPSIIPTLVTFGVVAPVPLSGAGNPNGLVAGVLGMKYYDTTAGVWYVCDGAGTVWTAV